jgi:hypothetical protein
MWVIGSMVFLVTTVVKTARVLQRKQRVGVSH